MNRYDLIGSIEFRYQGVGIHLGLSEAMLEYLHKRNPESEARWSFMLMDALNKVADAYYQDKENEGQ